MMGTAAPDTNPFGIDPLEYLAALDGNLSASECLEHYQVLKLVLLRLQSEDRVAFDLALQEVSRKLKIKARSVKTDLAALATPPAAKEARELLDKMGRTRILRLAQDYQEGTLWVGVMAGSDKLLLNSDRELLTLDKVPETLTVQDRGFDLCRLSKEAVLLFLSGGTATGYELLADLRNFFTRFAVFRDKRISLLLATWTLGTYCYRIFACFPTSPCVHQTSAVASRESWTCLARSRLTLRLASYTRPKRRFSEPPLRTGEHCSLTR